MTSDGNNTRSFFPNGRLTADGDGAEVSSRLPDAKLVEDRATFMKLALGELTPRQKFVMECRLGLRGPRVYTFREIAALMGVGVSSVHKIYTKALNRMVAWGGERSYIGREVNSTSASPSTMRAEHPPGGEESGVCLSPFIPEHHGVQPGSWPAGTLEWWIAQVADE